MAGAPEAAPRLVKRKEAAAELEISRQRVEALLKRWPDVEGPGGIDIERLKTLREKNSDPLRQAVYQQQRKLTAVAVDAPTAEKPANPPTSASDPEPELPLEALDFTGARTRRERANAQLAELKAAQEAGRLIPRQEVQAREFAVARNLRDRISNFPSKVQHFLTPEATQMLTKECRALIEELQKDAARIAAEDF